MISRFTVSCIVCLALCQLALYAAATPPARRRPGTSPELTTGLTPLVDRLAASRVGLLMPLPRRRPRPQPAVALAPRARKWDNLHQMVRALAQQDGLDPRLVELVVEHESAFNPRAVSRTGAMGLMQLMPSTASALGVSNPFDPVQNVAAGVRYLATQIRRFGDLSLALAAYNAGPGAVERWGGVPPYRETINYVNSIVAQYSSHLPVEPKKASDGRT